LRQRCGETRKRTGLLAGWLVLFGWISVASSQTVTVTGRVELDESSKRHKAESVSPSVVWLTPVSPPNSESAGAFLPSDSPPKLIQRNKSFVPHLLVVPVGSAVEFPNRDPFFHNVFSLFEGKRFDLGLYEAGSARLVHFDRPT